ncbi:MAG TPA: hypothetical protein VMR66_05750 [Gemmatimonadota bacterium]|nr:hypothetical protein [Gemmatimonadota bacterium]
MNLTCPQCGTVYDVSQYAQGHTFQCQCGRELKVGEAGTAPAAAAPTAAAPAGGAPPPKPGDPGLEPIVKVLVFFANLCFSPLAAIASVVVWLVIKEERPRTAKDLCQMTWIPFVVWAILVGLYIAFMGVAIFSGIMGSATY